MRSGLLCNTLERSCKQLGLGAEILENDWLGYSHSRRNIGHACLLVTDGGKHGHRRIEDGLAPSSGRQAAASRPLNADTFGVARL